MYSLLKSNFLFYPMVLHIHYQKPINGKSLQGIQEKKNRRTTGARLANEDEATDMCVSRDY